MHKVVNEVVYFPHDVFVSRTTTLSLSSKLLYHQPLLIPVHFYIPLSLKLIPIGIAYQTILLICTTHAIIS